MNKAEFLSKLADEARGNLSVELTQALVCEVSGHLDDSIQARLELGEAPEVAEINAVAAFATPASFVHRMERVHDSARAHDRVLLALGSIFVLLLSFCFTASTAASYEDWIWSVFVLLAAIFGRSCFLRSPRWGTLKVLTIASIVLIGGVQPLLWVNLWSYGGMGYVPTASLPSFIRTWRSEHDHPSLMRGLDVNLAEANLRAARQAAAAPLSEHWRRSFGRSGGLMIFSIAALIIAHLLPIAFRRRWQRRRFWRA